MTNLLNEIKNLSEEANNLAIKVSEVDTKIEINELEQIHKIIAECKGGFKFNKMMSENISWNNFNNWKDDETTYLKEKGVFLTEYNTYTHRDVYGSRTEDYELWLMQNGELRVYKCEEINSNYQDASNHLERCFITNNILEHFEFEDILTGIKKALERRLASLSNRTKAQEERIEKLNKYL